MDTFSWPSASSSRRQSQTSSKAPSLDILGKQPAILRSSALYYRVRSCASLLPSKCRNMRQVHPPYRSTVVACTSKSSNLARDCRHNCPFPVHTIPGARGNAAQHHGPCPRVLVLVGGQHEQEKYGGSNNTYCLNSRTPENSRKMAWRCVAAVVSLTATLLWSNAPSCFWPCPQTPTTLPGVFLPPSLANPVHIASY